VRELAEEVGLREFELGPCVSVRDHWFTDMPGWGGQSDRILLVRSAAFDPAPESSVDQLASEGVTGQRWWTRDELQGADTLFSPRRLPSLLSDLLDHGSPREPIDVGV
jgi:NUDIX domain